MQTMGKSVWPLAGQLPRRTGEEADRQSDIGPLLRAAPPRGNRATRQATASRANRMPRQPRQEPNDLRLKGLLDRLCQTHPALFREEADPPPPDTTRAPAGFHQAAAWTNRYRRSFRA